MSITIHTPRLTIQAEDCPITICPRISAYLYGNGLRKTVFGDELSNANNGAVGIEKKQAETARFALLRQTVAPAYRITLFRLTSYKAFKESGFLFA